MARKTPLRKCTGCGEVKEKKALVRVVRNKENEFFIDKTGKMNGRGAYVCDDEDCFLKAIKNKGFERSFKQGISKEIYEKLMEEWNNHE